jgi:hypothetical protein
VTFSKGCPFPFLVKKDQSFTQAKRRKHFAVTGEVMRFVIIAIARQLALCFHFS